uniref:Uncharacterized protein n=1 Tax=Aegilops tauschii subsp. strangulata TaxID=200361 RepID=A0A453NES9_AEGTS
HRSCGLVLAFFFISGVDANCRANEKLIVMVAAAAKGAPTPSQGSPAATATTPPSSPSGGAPPNSPAAPNAPAGNSTPAKDAPPGAASGAGLTVAGLAGSFVALFGYAMLAF